MIKRRGVVLSTTNKPSSIGKSKSANFKPQVQDLSNHSLNHPIMPIGYQSGAVEPMADQQMVQSNLIEEQPTRMVNHAYYTYQDPDHENLNAIYPPEQNQQYVIESMHKKIEKIQAKKKEEFLRKAQEKKKPSLPHPIKQKRQNRYKQASKTVPMKVNEVRSHTAKCQRGNKFEKRHKCTRPNCHQFQNETVENQEGGALKRSIDSQVFKPKPLDFRVDMFDKNSLHSPHKIKKEHCSTTYKLNGRAQTQKPNPFSTSQLSISGLQNFNCRRLPFRLCEFP